MPPVPAHPRPWRQCRPQSGPSSPGAQSVFPANRPGNAAVAGICEPSSAALDQADNLLLGIGLGHVLRLSQTAPSRCFARRFWEAHFRLRRWGFFVPDVVPEPRLSAPSAITEVIFCPSGTPAIASTRTIATAAPISRAMTGTSSSHSVDRRSGIPKAVLPGDRNDLSGRWLVYQEQHPEGGPCHGQRV
jgi:hypothetical protein